MRKYLVMFFALLTVGGGLVACSSETGKDGAAGAGVAVRDVTDGSCGDLGGKIYSVGSVEQKVCNTGAGNVTDVTDAFVCYVCHQDGGLVDSTSTIYADIAASKHTMAPSFTKNVRCQPCHKTGGPNDFTSTNAFKCTFCHDNFAIHGLATDANVEKWQASCSKCHGAFDNSSMGLDSATGKPVNLKGITSSADNASGFHPTGHYTASSGAGTGKAHNNLVDNATGVRNANNNNLLTANFIEAQLSCGKCHSPHDLKAPAKDNASIDTAFNWSRSAGCISCHRDIGDKMVNIRYKDNTLVAPINAQASTFKDKSNNTVSYNFSGYYGKINPAQWSDNGTKYWDNTSAGVSSNPWLHTGVKQYNTIYISPNPEGFMADNSTYFPNRHIMTKGCGYVKSGCHILNANPIDNITAAIRIAGGGAGTATYYTKDQTPFGCTTCHIKLPTTPDNTVGFSIKAGLDNHTNTMVTDNKSNIGCGFGKSSTTGVEILCHARGALSSLHGTTAVNGVTGAGYTASGSQVSFQYQEWDNNTALNTTGYTRAVAEAQLTDTSLGSAHKKKGVMCADCHDPHFVNRDAPASMGLTKGCFDAGCHESDASSHSSYVNGTKTMTRSAYALSTRTNACVTCHSVAGQTIMRGNLFHTAPARVYDGTNASLLNYMVTYPNGVAVTDNASCQAQFDNTTAGKLPLPYGYTSVVTGGTGSCIIRFDQ